VQHERGRGDWPAADAVRKGILSGSPAERPRWRPSPAAERPTAAKRSLWLLPDYRRSAISALCVEGRASFDSAGLALGDCAVVQQMRGSARPGPSVKPPKHPVGVLQQHRLPPCALTGRRPTVPMIAASGWKVGKHGTGLLRAGRWVGNRTRRAFVGHGQRCQRAQLGRRHWPQAGANPAPAALLDP